MRFESGTVLRFLLLVSRGLELAGSAFRFAGFVAASVLSEVWSFLQLEERLLRSMLKSGLKHSGASFSLLDLSDWLASGYGIDVVTKVFWLECLTLKTLKLAWMLARFNVRVDRLAHDVEKCFGSRLQCHRSRSLLGGQRGTESEQTLNTNRMP